MVLLVREPAILLIKWLRPKGLKVCSYVEKYAEFKNQTLKKIGWYTKMLCATEYPGGRQFLSTEMGYPKPHNLISPTLHPKENFAFVPNCFLGPHE